MSSKTTLNAKNLEALGAERLAQLLIEVSTGNAAAKRQLRLALAGARSPAEAAREIAKRLASIARARSFITWKNRKPLVTDLEGQRRAIVEQIAPADPAEALALMWRFMMLATSIFERCDDSSGTVIGIFHQACADLGQLATRIRPDPHRLAGMLVNALQDNGYGQYDGLIAIMTPALGGEGLAALKLRVEELGRTTVPVPPKDQWKALGWGMDGALYEHEMQAHGRANMVTMALKEIADAQGDVDAFIAQYDPKALKVPQIAAEIAARLLAAGKASEALGYLDRAEHGAGSRFSLSWQDIRLEVLEALGRDEEAQAIRMDFFKRTLAGSYLRDYLTRLPDFDDMEAEERAMAYAGTHPTFLAALQLFLDWPALDRAAQLLISRHTEIDGDYYEYLVPAAEALAERYPLAATLVLRGMIDFTLTGSRSKRYRYAAGHLAVCAQLAGDIPDFGAFETHEAYVARLKKEHGRKSGFWERVTF
jgi:hypothetical protein